MLKFDSITIIILTLTLIFIVLVLLRFYGKKAKKFTSNKQSKKDGQIARAEQELLNKICEEVGLTVRSRRAVKETKKHDGTKELEEVIMYPSFAKNSQGKYTKITFKNGFNQFSEWENNLINGFNKKMVAYKLANAPFKIQKTGIANEYQLTEGRSESYLFDYSKDLAYIKDGKTIYQKAAIEKIVLEMRAEARKSGSHIMFAGELYDLELNAPIRKYFSLKDEAHMLTVGIPGSGKSKGAIAELFFLCLAYSDIEIQGDKWEGEKLKFYFGDGSKSGADFVPFLFASEYPVALKKVDLIQPAVELANSVNVVYNEHIRRKNLMEKYGVSTTAELSKKTGEKYDRLFLMVDEFSGFVLSGSEEGSGDSYFVKAINTPGTFPNKIREILSAGRASACSVWLLSQRYTKTDMPPAYRSMATNIHVYNMPENDIKSVGADPSYKDLPKGTYQLKPGGGSPIPLRMPYIGNFPETLLNIYFPNNTSHLQRFDLDLIAMPEQSEFSNEREIWIRLKKGIFSGYKITALAAENAISSTLSFAVAEKDGYKIGFGFIESDELVEDIIRVNINKGNNDLNLLFTLDGKDSLNKKIKELNTIFDDIKIVSLPSYRKPMVANCVNISLGLPTIPWLDNYIASIKADKESEDKIDSNIKEVKRASTSTTWSYNNLVPKAILSASMVQKLANTKDKDVKGILLEAAYARYSELRSEEMGYVKVLAGDKLHKSGTIIPEHLDAGDGGADIVAIRADTSMHIIQTKCYSPDFPIEQKLASEWLNLIRGWMDSRVGKDVSAYNLTFVTTSFFTSNARALLEQNGVECVDGEELKKRFEAYKIEAPKKSPGRPRKEVSPDSVTEKRPVGRPRKVQ